jgi:hypothetical protein
MFGKTWILFDRKENGSGIDYSQRRIPSGIGLVIAVVEGLETKRGLKKSVFAGKGGQTELEKRWREGSCLSSK